MLARATASALRVTEERTQLKGGRSVRAVRRLVTAVVTVLGVPRVPDIVVC